MFRRLGEFFHRYRWPLIGVGLFCVSAGAQATWAVVVGIAVVVTLVAAIEQLSGRPPVVDALLRRHRELRVQIETRHLRIHVSWSSELAPATLEPSRHA